MKSKGYVNCYLKRIVLDLMGDLNRSFGRAVFNTRAFNQAQDLFYIFFEKPAIFVWSSDLLYLGLSKAGSNDKDLLYQDLFAQLDLLLQLFIPLQ